MGILYNRGMFIIFVHGRLFYNQMTINQKINLKQESLKHHHSTVVDFLKRENRKLSQLK